MKIFYIQQWCQIACSQNSVRSIFVQVNDKKESLLAYMRYINVGLKYCDEEIY